MAGPEPGPRPSGVSGAGKPKGLAHYLVPFAVVGAVVAGVIAYAELAEDDADTVAAAAQAQTRTVSRAELGEAWPLTVESGALACAGGAITIDVGGTKYAVNGTAKSTGALDITPVWAPNPTVAGLRKSLEPLIAEGQRLCR